LRRRVLFPVLLVYVAILVVAALPESLVPDALSGPPRSARHVLWQLGWPAGMSVFSGRSVPEKVSVRWCYRISGYTREGSRDVLFDTMDGCRDGARDVFKDPYVRYHRKMLGRSLAHLRHSHTHRNRNAYPLSALFAIADYHCHRTRISYDRLVFTSEHQQADAATRGLEVERVVEGAHYCDSGRWLSIVDKRTRQE